LSIRWGGGYCAADLLLFSAALLPIYVQTFSFQEIFLMALIIFLTSIFALVFSLVF
jgi:hypothetical protein